MVQNFELVSLDDDDESRLIDLLASAAGKKISWREDMSALPQLLLSSLLSMGYSVT